MFCTATASVARAHQQHPGREGRGRLRAVGIQWRRAESATLTAAAQRSLAFELMNRDAPGDIQRRCCCMLALISPHAHVVSSLRLANNCGCCCAVGRWTACRQPADIVVDCMGCRTSIFAASARDAFFAGIQRGTRSALADRPVAQTRAWIVVEIFWSRQRRSRPGRAAVSVSRRYGKGVGLVRADSRAWVKPLSAA